MHVLYECAVSGVTYDNENGESRQSVLESLMDYWEVASLRLEDKSGIRPKKDDPGVTEPFTGIAIYVTSVGHWPTKGGYAPDRLTPDGTFAEKMASLARQDCDPNDRVASSRAFCALHKALHYSGERMIGWIPEISGDLGRLRALLADREQTLQHVTAVITSMGRSQGGRGAIGLNIRIFAMPRRVRV